MILLDSAASHRDLFYVEHFLFPGELLRGTAELDYGCVDHYIASGDRFQSSVEPFWRHVEYIGSLCGQL